MCKGKGEIQADISVTWKPIELTPEIEDIDRLKRLLQEMTDCFTVDTSHYSFSDFVTLTQEKEKVIEQAKKVINQTINNRVI